MQLSLPQKLIYNTEKYIGSSSNNICGYILFEERYSHARTEEAVNELYRLNEALRTEIEEKGGEVRQHIGEYKHITIGSSIFKSREELEKYCAAAAREPIGLGVSLSRIEYFELNDKSGIICRFHHIISDAWSMSLVGSQMCSLLENKTPEAYSYSGYCENEKKYLSGKAYLRDRDYFVGRFDQFGEPTLFSEKENKTFDAERISFSLGKQNTDMLREYADSKSVSVDNVITAVFSVLFSRLKMNCEKFCIGMPVINRGGEAERNTMGMFVNTAPLFVEIDSDASFAENLKSISGNMLLMMRHQKYNYGELLDELRANRNFTGRLYDVLISRQNASFPEGVSESRWFGSGVQAESLRIHIEDRDNTGSLSVHYDYQTEKFTSGNIERLHGCFLTLLADSFKDDTAKIADLEIISPEEKSRLIKEFNNTEYAFDRNATLASLFEKNADSHPEKVCLLDNGREITLKEFSETVRALDCEIRKIAGTEGRPIGIICDRSIEMYASVYAVVRSGNAYMPIDVHQPAARTAYMIENSGAVLVLGQGKYRGAISSDKFFDVTAFLENKHIPAEYPPPAAAPDGIAYIIYTSGTTGNPKGAMIKHRSIVNRINWMHRMYPTDDGSVILQKTPYTFDVSVWELFWWGIFGGKLAFSKPDEHFLPAKIAEEIINNNVTHIHFVPSVFSVFLDYLEKNPEIIKELGSLKYIFLSGEALKPQQVDKFCSLFHGTDIRLHNLYGPTECAVDVTYYDCPPCGEKEIPIGKPIDNTKIYITDNYLNLMPVNTPGELCIAGENVGAGYINNPELTAEKFVDDPFGTGKLYKTGDLAYFRGDGNIIYIGRKDTQIKINGQRIETGEIESVILSLQGITSAGVIVKNSGSGSFLEAFYSGKEFDDELLVSACSEKLPGYMIPSVFVHLNDMPVSKNGKLDKKALSAIEVPPAETASGIGRTNETVQTVCDSFRKILKKDNIDEKTNFFRAGGTSIDVISFVSEEKYSGLTVNDFTADPTPKGIAEKLINRKTASMKYISALKQSCVSDKAVIIFPFAGGTSASFSMLAEKISGSLNCSVYFADHVHSDEELLCLAEEIKEIAGIYDVVFYSHCVGTPLAVKAAAILEKSGISLKGIISAGYVPGVSFGGRNIWGFFPDGIIKKVLAYAGADLSSLTEENIRMLIGRFRDDTDYINGPAGASLPEITAPADILLADKDIFTRMAKDPRKAFSPAVKHIATVTVFKGKNHYFQNEKADLILSKIRSAFER